MGGLQQAIQAMLDAASSIVSIEHLGEPRTNHELFDLLATGGWMRTEDVERYPRIVGCQDVLVHQDLEVDPGIVYEVVTTRLGDLLSFVAALRARLESTWPSARPPWLRAVARRRAAASA